MLEVNYAELQNMEDLVKNAIKLEQTIFRKDKDQKNASWLIRSASQMGIEMDDDMKAEVEDALGKKTDKRQEFNKKRVEKREDKVQMLKEKMKKTQEDMKMKRITHSSFLTPEAAEYLNE